MWLFEEGWPTISYVVITHIHVLNVETCHFVWDQNIAFPMRGHVFQGENQQVAASRTDWNTVPVQHSSGEAGSWPGTPPCVPSGLPYRNPMMPGTMAEDIELTPWGRGRGHRHLGTGHNGRSTSDEMAMDAKSLGDKKLLSPPAHEKRAETADKVGST